jgi:hypothetical protein
LIFSLERGTVLHRPITYEDFNGNLVTENFYFNLSKAELIELEVSYDTGLAAAMQRIIDEKDNKKLVSEFKRIILLSYGVKSEDGKRFRKSNELREEFEQTAAYQSLFVELATNSMAATEFINGIIPRDMVASASKPIIAPLPPSA